MRTLSAPLLALLNNGNQFIMADLYTITLANSTTLRYTSAGADIVYSGFTYLSSGLLISRKGVRWVVGIEVDTMTMDIAADSSVTVNGMPLIAAALQGQFDGALVAIDRLFLNDSMVPVDKLKFFYGRVSNFEAERTVLSLTIKSGLEVLNISMPPNLYQSSCTHTLYDSGCKVNKAANTVSGTVVGMNSDGSMRTTLAAAASFYNMGGIKMTTGANAGLTRTVKTHNGTGAATVIYFTTPFPNVPTAGDTFTISPGCDKLRTGDCTNKYSNTINFKGFEFIPVPETAA